MQALRVRLVAIAGSVAAFAGAVAAQSVVVGVNNPDLDVAAVQEAVDRGGSVVLLGHFSFDKAPAAPAGRTYSRMVTVSKNVEITGAIDANGELPLIEGGEWPFFVDAVDAHVTIRQLHFVHPRAGAIWIYAVRGLAVAGCRIESVEATATFGTQAGQPSPLAAAIFAGANPHPPSAAQPGVPENFPGAFRLSTMISTLAGPRRSKAWASSCSASGGFRIGRWT